MAEGGQRCHPFVEIQRAAARTRRLDDLRRAGLQAAVTARSSETRLLPRKPLPSGSARPVAPSRPDSARPRRCRTSAPSRPPPCARLAAARALLTLLVPSAGRRTPAAQSSSSRRRANGGRPRERGPLGGRRASARVLSGWQQRGLVREGSLSGGAAKLAREPLMWEKTRGARMSGRARASAPVRLGTAVVLPVVLEKQ